jgi:predicted NBD/HSP70 family sugar kinase
VIRDRFAGRLADAIRILELSVGPDVIIIGGGVSHVGEPLLTAVAAALRGQADGSPFLAALDLAGRTRLLPGTQPVGAIGAALIGSAE